MLVGPFVAWITPVNNTFAVARLPPNVPCSQVTATNVLQTLGTKEDRLFASMAPTVSKASVCTNNAILRPDDFSWSWGAAIRAPTVDIQIEGPGARRQIAAAFSVEAGGNTVRPTIQFLVSWPNAGASSIEDLHLGRIRIASDPGFTEPLPFRSAGAHVVEMDLTPPATPQPSMSVYVESDFGPRVFQWQLSIPVTAPQIWGRLTQSNPSSPNCSLLVRPLGGDQLVDVVIVLSPQAAVGVSLEETPEGTSSCLSTFPGLTCRFPSVSSRGVGIALMVKIPDFYEFEVNVTFTVTASNVRGPLSGQIALAGRRSMVAVSPNATLLATPVPQPPPQAANGLNGIFAGIGGSGVNCTNPFTLILLVYVVCCIASALYGIYRQRKRPHVAEDTYLEVPLLSSLLIHHAWLSMLMPCHYHCLLVHFTLSFAHIVTLLALTAALIQGLGFDSPGVVYSAALLAGIVAAAPRPLLSYGFWIFTTNEGDGTPLATKKSTFTAITRNKSIANGATMSPGALEALDAIELVSSGSDDEGDDKATKKQPDTPPGKPKNNACSNSTTNSSSDHNDDDGSEGEGSTDVIAVDGSVTSPNLPPLIHLEVSPHRNRSFMLSCGLSVLMLIIGYYFSATVPGPEECTALENAWWLAIIVDIAIYQTAAMVVVAFYRWFTMDDDDMGINIQGQPTMWSELHPYPGEKRYFVL